MPFNGNGQFDPASPQYPAIVDTVILAADWNAIVADIATGLSLVWTRDGQAGALADLSMGGFKLRALATAVTGTDAVNLTQATTNVTLGGLTLNVIATTLTVTSTTVVLPAGTSIGAVSAAELLTLDGATSNLQAQINTKGAVGGQTWTGSHVFPATISLGAVTAAEIAFMAGVTSAIQTQLNTLQTNINAKGAITNQTWLGTQIFTGAIITVPTQASGNNSSLAASTAFVAATAFNAALPAQSIATAGKFVSSDGTNASWQNVSLDPINYLLNVT